MSLMIFQVSFTYPYLLALGDCLDTYYLCLKRKCETVKHLEVLKRENKKNEFTIDYFYLKIVRKQIL